MGRNSYKGMIIALVIVVAGAGFWLLANQLTDRQPPQEPLPKSSQTPEKGFQELFTKESEALKQHIAAVRDYQPDIYPFEDGLARDRNPSFGWRVHPIWATWDFHTGVDIEAKMDEPIHAVASGVVTRAEYYGGYGLCVDIKHDGQTETRYAKCSKLLVKVGQTVRKEDTIALVGMTGTTTGPHLHFEVIVNREPVDPDEYIYNMQKMKGGIYAPKR